MNISIKTKNMSLSDELRDFINEKLSSLEKYVPEKEGREILAEVCVGKTTNHHQKGDIYKAEIIISFDGEVHRIQEERDYVHVAIDEAKDEMERHLRRAKNKKRNIFRKGGAMAKRFLKFRK